MNTPLLRSAVALSLCLCASAHAQTVFATKAAVVSAQVLETCKYNGAATPLALSLGPLNPALGTAQTQTHSVDFSCTHGTPIQVGVAGQTPSLSPTAGQGRLLTHTANPQHTLAYTLSAALPGGSIGKGFGPGNQLTLSLTTEVRPQAYIDAARGDYEENLVIELRP